MLLGLHFSLLTTCAIGKCAHSVDNFFSRLSTMGHLFTSQQHHLLPFRCAQPCKVDPSMRVPGMLEACTLHTHVPQLSTAWQGVVSF
jgi:hypothetical protein